MDPYSPLFLPSASKHHIALDDAVHAYRNPIKVFEMDDDMTMYIGPAEDGTLLEVGTIQARDHPTGVVLIAHVMRARDKFLRSGKR